MREAAKVKIRCAVCNRVAKKKRGAVYCGLNCRQIAWYWRNKQGKTETNAEQF
jgi:hypothetical protein